MGEIDYRESFKWYQKAAKQMMNLDNDELSRINFYKIRYGAGNIHARSKAIKGDIYVQLYLGCLYKHGYEIKQNYKKAFAWYEEAANQGSKDAMYSLGDFYKNGKGVEKNHIKAPEWIKKSDAILTLI